jgi:putative pyrroloquinoline-quinone binding quinoprotein
VRRTRHQIYGFFRHCEVEVKEQSALEIGLNGKTWTARRIADGKELWKQTSTDAFDKVDAWGPSTVHGTTVYAAQGSYISGLNGKDGSEAWHGVMTGSVSVVLQGSGVWGVDNLNSGLGGVVAFDADSKKQVWTYPLTRRALHWITGDGTASSSWMERRCSPCRCSEPAVRRPVPTSWGLPPPPEA